jgi:uncharacterized protein (TIGR02265 family)
MSGETAMQGHEGAMRPPRPTRQHGAMAEPTIKGIFVMSHVKALRRAAGHDSLAELERRFGGPVQYGITEDVPTADEGRLIEIAVRILSNGAVAEESLAYEAGRLHYRNFTATPWCRLLFSLFPRDFLFMMRHAPGIAEKVFRNVGFEVDEPGPGALRIVMINGGYPLDHFRGLFTEWMTDFGFDGKIVAQQPSPERQEFLLQWD